MDEKSSDQQVLWKDAQMAGKIKWEGLQKKFLPHLSVINMEKEQHGSASPPTNRMLSCFLGIVKKASS